jgi:hypothetical protein
LISCSERLAITNGRADKAHCAVQWTTKIKSTELEQKNCGCSAYCEDFSKDCKCFDLFWPFEDYRIRMGGILSLTSLACCFTSTACTAGCALCPNCKVSLCYYQWCGAASCWCGSDIKSIELLEFVTSMDIFPCWTSGLEPYTHRVTASTQPKWCGSSSESLVIMLPQFYVRPSTVLFVTYRTRQCFGSGTVSAFD